jgi:diaminopimelate epimerase
MLLEFTKMHGTGNDFVVIDLISQRCRLRPEDVRRLADRHYGIGCDQLLLVEPPGSPDADFRYRIFNADGNEVEQCGNGARCFARFVRDRKLTTKRVIRVETAAGEIELRVRKGTDVEVDMGVPRFEPGDIPLVATQRQAVYSLTVEGQAYELGALSMGNPHAILRVDDVDAAPVERLGPLLEAHPDFPERANVSFLQVVDSREIRLRVFERGVGETLACGTGACASVVHGIARGWLQDPVTVSLPGGKLSISWAGEDQPVIMTGPTAVVFEGTIKIQGAG